LDVRLELARSPLGTALVTPKFTFRRDAENRAAPVADRMKGESDD
jgi:hypothetical protein